MKRMACVLALATGAGLGVTMATPASAAPAHWTAASGFDIAIVPPATATGDSKIGLDVRFRNGDIQTIELYLDGKLAARQPLHLHDRQGVITFDLDATQLSEGGHAILVKAFDSAGNSATATSRLRIAPDTFAGVARFLAPRNRQMVKGIVPLEVTIDPSIQHPFVSFAIDGAFLALMNTPPYTYNWDSAKVDNGPHSVGFDVYDSVTNAKIKTVVMQINVNNPGGYTKIQPSNTENTPAVAKPGKPTPNALLSAAESALPTADLAAPSASATPARPAERLMNALGLRSSAPSPVYGNPSRRIGDAHPVNAPGNRVLTASANFVSTLDLHALNATPAKPGTSSLASALRTAAPAVKFTANRLAALPPSQTETGPRPQAASVAAPGLAAVFANPSDLAKLDAPDSLTGSHLALPSALPRRAGNIAARPAMRWGGLAARALPAAPVSSSAQASVVASSSLAHTVRAANRLAVRHSSLLMGMHVRTFGVAFNNRPVHFDVAPRVENGLPLAPFRQIFEQTGGTVSWVNGSQTVRAVNATKDIEIRVGKKTAKVNNKPVTMDAKAYVDKGRTIVPLTFVRDALDVKVNYDAKTGRLLIESK